MKRLARKFLISCTIFTIMAFGLSISSSAACPLTSLFSSSLGNGLSISNSCSSNNSLGNNGILSQFFNNSTSTCTQSNNNCNSGTIVKGTNSQSKNSVRKYNYSNIAKTKNNNSQSKNTANNSNCNKISGNSNNNSGSCNVTDILKYFGNCNTNSACTAGNCDTDSICTTGNCANDNACTTGNCDTDNTCTTGNCANDNACTTGNCDTDNTCTTGNCDTDNTCTTGNCDTSIDNSSTYAEQVLYYVNQARAENNLPALSLNTKLNKAAEIRAKEIAVKFSHTRPNGTSCFTVMSEVGLSYKSVGENIAYGYANAKSVVDGWMSSPGHRANILSSKFTYMGLGNYNNNWAQLFMS